MEERNYIEEVRDLSREAVQPFTSEPVHFAVVPQGSEVVSLKDYQYPNGIRPERISAGPKFQDAVSFCSYVNLFKDDRTRIFADASVNSLAFLALLDYHGVGDRKPEFISHRAALVLKLSEEWKLWTAQNDKLIPQSDFAEFLEDNRSDIVEPDSATMLEIARDLQAHSDVNFASKINSRNGSAVLNFEETIKATVSNGTIEVPETFKIRIPVFFGEAAIDVRARLRFRITEGKLRFQYKLDRPLDIISKAFDLARKEIARSTTIEVFLGTL